MCERERDRERVRERERGREKTERTHLVVCFCVTFMCAQFYGFGFRFLSMCVFNCIVMDVFV